MKLSVCEKCGGNGLKKRHNLLICEYCGSEYLIQKNDNLVHNSVIELNSDIQRLLNKCKVDPGNARKYANLILDIDPTNTEVKKYLR